MSKIKASKASKVVKPARRKQHTAPSHRNHRFESFSERVGKLKIDPVRRRRNAGDLDDARNETATFFGKALEEWRELNLSQVFTDFAREASPLCDTLPVVLHNAELIMNLLILYIEKRDALALEPLLSLLSHFAHDLDAHFEKHFELAVSTVTAVAASHPDPAVVEWCFTSLAWLFKYLSRLLTPDLRPLYDLMSPYLGKAPQKPFIIRFAAESLSFLVRKTAATYQKDPAPTDLLVSRVLNDCQTAPDFQCQGVMTLLTEAIKGIQSGVHSSGVPVFQSMLAYASEYAQEGRDISSELIVGALTSLIHHTNSDTFRPVQNSVLSQVLDLPEQSSNRLVNLYADLVFTAASVRKGTRISDWGTLVKATTKLLQLGQREGCIDSTTRIKILRTMAVTLQLSTIDAVLPTLDVLAQLRSGPWKTHFLPFCDFFSRLGGERFQQLLMPQYQKFAIESWHGYRDNLFLTMPRILQRTGKALLNCSTDLLETVHGDVNRLSDSVRVGGVVHRELATASLVLRALTNLRTDNETDNRLCAQLKDLVVLAWSPQLVTSHDVAIFAVATALTTLLDVGVDRDFIARQWPLICAQSSRFKILPVFWINVLRILRKYPLDPVEYHGEHMQILESALIEALSAPSHEIRQSALEIAEKLHFMKEGKISSIVSIALAIEKLPVSLDNSRAISMGIRRLPIGYSDTALSPFLQQAIPTYCFGLLHLQLSQAWTDAIQAMVDMSSHHSAENIIINQAQRWLAGAMETDRNSTSGPKDRVLDVTSDGFQVVSDFECSNLARISAIAEQVFCQANSGYPSSEHQFEIDHGMISLIPTTARSQALRVLKQVPSLAEKRSRMLVPTLLSWAGSGESERNDTDSFHRWSRKDQKAMLEVFAQFVNPRVLYRSTDVHGALLNLCANGDGEIQSASLKALFAWKDPVLLRYKEHLVNVLDEARFRDELSVFLQGAGTAENATVAEVDHPQLMPVLLRLLYGRAVAGGSQGQTARRKAIFVALSQFGDHVLEGFLDIALQCPGQDKNMREAELTSLVLFEPKVPLRQQLGMLHMVNDMLGTLGPSLTAFDIKITRHVLLATVSASRSLDNNATDNVALLRAIRQAGLQCLSRVLPSVQAHETTPYGQVAVENLILPRLSNFVTENTESVSGVLRLIAACSSVTALACYLVDIQPSVLSSVASLLGRPTAKDDVRLFILQNILDNYSHDETHGVLKPWLVKTFVQSIGALLSQQPTKDVLDVGVASLMGLTARLQDSEEAETVIEVCTTLLRKPAKTVSASTKIGLLRTMLPLAVNFRLSMTNFTYETLCGLFSRLRGSENRTVLSSVLVALTAGDEGLNSTAKICEDLNSMGDKLGDLDEERRDRGFSTIYNLSQHLSVQQWQPIVHNCLFFIRDDVDMVARTSAAQGLEKFSTAASASFDDFKCLVADVVLAGLAKGMKESSEVVRAEYLRLLGRLTLQLPEWSALSDMKCLTVEGDDEASIFDNLLHIQQHRRLRALRRLSNESANLSSSNITRYFLPLLEHFIFDQAEGDAGRTLSDQTIETLGALARALSWSSFRMTFKRYLGYLSSREILEKPILRLLGAFANAFESTPGGATPEDQTIARSQTVTKDFLPPLMDYIHRKDESTVDRRMPVAITIVKLLLTLPEDVMTERLAPVMTDISHVLRSRSQEARDQTRKTIATILSLVGPPFFGFILKELRTALQRGYQLHVLSFTVHSLLLKAVEISDPGDLNYCLEHLTAVIMDDIFGVTGHEKDAEGYKSAMKEVKSSKSFDSMELLARVTPIEKLGELIKPIRLLLSESLNLKMLKKIEDLLTRLRKGLDQNPGADSRDMLIFCHEIVRQVYAEQKTDTTLANGTPKRHAHRHNIQVDLANRCKSRAPAGSQILVLSSFALNLLRHVLRRHSDLMTPANIAGFLPIAGDGLVGSREDVQLASVKLLCTIIKVPLGEIEESAPVYVREAVRLIKGVSSVTTDTARAGLELITSVLREKRSVEIRERDIADVLRLLKADLDEPDRQGVIYKFLRAVLGRKILATEVYEVMDEVGKIMITNPDRTVRENARSTYLQFTIEYPQGRARWNRQMSFLAENLKYERPTGRQSVMECFHQLFLKAGEEVLAPVRPTLFVALVPVLTDDGEKSCRDMAGALIGKIFELASQEQLEGLLLLMEKWVGNTERPRIQAAALQCWAVLLQSRVPDTRRLHHLLELVSTFTTFESHEDLGKVDGCARAALLTMEVLIERVPSVAFHEQSYDIWKRLSRPVTACHLLIKESITRLIGQCFTHLASASAKSGRGLVSVPLLGTHGLQLGAEELRRMCYTHLATMQERSDQISADLLENCTRNLGFLGRCFAANGMSWRSATTDQSDSEEQSTDEELAEGESALAYLLNRLSYIIRQDTVPTASRATAMKVEHLLLPHIERLPHVPDFIRPLYLLTDPSIPQPPGQVHADLCNAARELMDMVQKKIGAEVFLTALGRVRKEVKERREERRVKRRVDAVSRPEAWARGKRRKLDSKKRKNVRDGHEARGKRRGW